MRFLPTIGVLALAAAAFLTLQPVPDARASSTACYEIYGEVRDLGQGWTHIVVVENNCDYWLQCSVWTNVDPQPPAMITIGPDMSERAQIASNAEEKEFKSYGSCRRK